MNKLVYFLVYVILIAAAAALYFEMNLFDKKELLKERNRVLEDYIVKIARTIEKDDAARSTATAEAKKDVSAIEAKLIETPETENLLEEYQLQLETANLDTFNWDNSNDRVQLRQLYYLENGQTVSDVSNDNKPLMKGKGTMAELLDRLFERCKAQQAKLNTTRAELAAMRGKLEELVADYNKIKPVGRQALLAEEETKAKIPPLEAEKQAAVEQTKKIKGQIDDLNAEVASLKDEVTTAKDETEVVKEDLEKAKKLNDQYKKLLANQQPQQNSGAARQGGVAVAQLTAGDKGRLVGVDNKNMFAIIEFSDDAMKELLGAEKQNPLPLIDVGVRRAVAGKVAGMYVGKLKLRQAVAGKNFVVADILGDWQQSPMKIDDAVFAD